MFFMVACNDQKPKEQPVDEPVIEQPIDTSIPNSPSGEAPIIESPDIVNTGTPAPTPAPVPAVEAAPAKESSSFLKINVKLVGASTAQAAKYQKAIAIAEKTINSKEFQDRINAVASFTSSTSNGKQVMAKLLSGAEKLSPTVDHELDIEVRFYYAANSTVGYTYPNVKYIMVNTKFFNGYTPSSVAANLTHEYMHKLGYGHTSYYNLARDKSVPYLIGSTVRLLGKKYE